MTSRIDNITKDNNRSKEIFKEQWKKMVEEEDHVKKRKISTPNPLKEFPMEVRSLQFYPTYAAIDGPKNARKIESKKRWLQSDSIDPIFGISGNSQEVQIRRAYRRIESSNVFNPTKRDDVSLTEIVTPLVPPPKKYVLIEQSRLDSLQKLENILRDEKEKLGEQCSMALSSIDIQPNIPTPAIKIAVNNFSEADMRHSAAELRKLKNAWDQYCEQNHYNRSYLSTTKDSMLNAPIVQRAMKLKMVKEISEKKLLRQERDFMQYEDDLAFLVQQYERAQSRRNDYNLYYVLAARYGSYSWEEFKIDEKPGKRYMKAVNRAVNLFQSLWGSYWAVKKEERRFSATLIQKIWRGHYKYRTLNPIIKCRKRMGKRTYYMFCWPRWLHYVKICKMIKEAIIYHRENWKSPCFNAWVKFVTEIKLRKSEIRRKFELKTKYGFVFNTFHAWKNWIKKSKQSLALMKRSMQNPHFDQWVRYTDFSKYMKKMNRATVYLQKLYRGRLTRKKTKHIRWGFSSIAKWGKAVLVATYMRKALAEKEWHIFAPKQRAKNIAKLNDLESRRLSRLHTTLEDVEKAARLSMRKHLRSKSGRIQVKQSTNRDIDDDAAENILYERCIDINVNMKRHDFDAENPPFLKCPNPHCSSTFVSYDQFTNHLESSDKHKDDDHLRNNTRIHLRMNHTRSVGLLKEYFSRVAVEQEELTKYLNIINLISDTIEWLPLLSSSDEYLIKGLNIYDKYLASDAPHKVPYDTIEKEIKQLEILKAFHSILDKSFYSVAELERMKFIRRTSLSKSWWRFVRGKPAKQFDEWTDEYVLSPMTYRDIQYKLSMILFEYLLEDHNKNKGFWTSPEGKMLEGWFQFDENVKHKELYKNYKEQRIQQIKLWARQYKKKEDGISRTAQTAADRLRREICDDLVDRYFIKLIEDKVITVRAKEQKSHEKMIALVADSALWIEEDVCDELYNIYMTIFLKNALSGGRKDRKPILVYAGIEQHHGHGKDQEVFKKIDNEAADLFKNMF